MKEYRIRRINNDGFPGSAEWKGIEAEIDCYPWDKSGYRPCVAFSVLYSEQKLYVRFKVQKDKIRAECTQLNDDVYTDSCVEFFIAPDPDGDERYFNFETNPLGVMLIGIGTDRYDRKLLYPENYRNLFGIQTYTNTKRGFWTVEYLIPVEFINRYYNSVLLRTGLKMKGNFYKCGDSTEIPHYGCWNPVKYGRPDFHRPEYFGELILS